MGAFEITDSVAFRLCLLLASAAAIAFEVVWWQDTPVLIFSACALGLFILVISYRLDYLHPTVPYLVPWLTVLIFSTIRISKYSRPLELSTASFLLATILTWLLATSPSRVAWSAAPGEAGGKEASGERISLRAIRGLIVGFGILYVFALVNVAYAGYVPLLSLVTTGDSGYLTFGIPSVYGAFLAYANAMGCLAFYVYLRTRLPLCLLLVASVLVIHVLFVTRQNIVTLMVEIFVIKSLVGVRFSRKAILASVATGLIAFSALGTLRSGDIKQIIGVTPDYSWLPSSIVWVYAYSYFNVINLENMKELSGAPFYDGSMWDSVFPTVLRPDTNHGSYTELAAAGVNSYIYPIYLDVGALGVLLATAVFGLLTLYVYRRATRSRRFVDVATYGCLYSCALLSFFVDFWLYLPVIFQVVFFRFFHTALLKERVRPTQTSSARLRG